MRSLRPATHAIPDESVVFSIPAPGGLLDIGNGIAIELDSGVSFGHFDSVDPKYAIALKLEDKATEVRQRLDSMLEKKE